MKFQRQLLQQNSNSNASYTIENTDFSSVVSSLKSASESDRLNAVKQISQLIYSPESLDKLLRLRLIKAILDNLLTDSNLEVIALALQVLTYIAIVRGRDPSLYMVREGIANKVSDISIKIIETLTQQLSDDQASITSQIASNCMSLISSIIINVGEVKGIDSVVQLALDVIQLEGKLECVGDAFELIYFASETSSELTKDINTVIQRATKTNSFTAKTYALGAQFNILINQDFDFNDMHTALEQLCTFFKQVPDNEVHCLQLLLEILAIASQTDDVDLANVLVNDVQPKVLELLNVAPLKQNCINVLNNIGWSLNGIGEPWSELADKVVKRTVDTCFPGSTLPKDQSPELTSSALGLLGSAITQSHKAEFNLKQLVNEILNLIEQLYNAQNIAWVDLTRSLVVLLAIPVSGTSICARLNLVDIEAKQIFLVLEKSSDPEAHIDVLNALYDVFADNDAEFNEEEYVSKQLNAKLEQLKPSIKRTIKSIPKTEPVRRQQGIDALTNLDHFIVYKKK